MKLISSFPSLEAIEISGLCWASSKTTSLFPRQAANIIGVCPFSFWMLIRSPMQASKLCIIFIHASSAVSSVQYKMHANKRFRMFLFSIKPGGSRKLELIDMLKYSFKVCSQFSTFCFVTTDEKKSLFQSMTILLHGIPCFFSWSNVSIRWTVSMSLSENAKESERFFIWLRMHVRWPSDVLSHARWRMFWSIVQSVVVRKVLRSVSLPLDTQISKSEKCRKNIASRSSSKTKLIENGHDSNYI